MAPSPTKPPEPDEHPQQREPDIRFTYNTSQALFGLEVRAALTDGDEWNDTTTN